MGQTQPQFLSDPMSDRKKSFCQLWNSPDIHRAQCCNKSFDISYHWHWTSIIFLTGYRHFHLKKGKVKQGFIYENAQKKMLENCNFCPGKSLKSPWFCSTKRCMNLDRESVYSETCLIWTLNIPYSCINQTWNKVKM